MPKVGTKSRHIYDIQVGYIKICTPGGDKSGVHEDDNECEKVHDLANKNILLLNVMLW